LGAHGTCKGQDDKREGRNAHTQVLLHLFERNHGDGRRRQ
jgi:hypothetical protein